MDNMQLLLLIGAISLCIYLMYSYNKKQSGELASSEPFYEEIEHNSENNEGNYNNTVPPAGNQPVVSQNVQSDMDNSRDEIEASQGLGHNEVFASVNGTDSDKGDFGLDNNQLPKDCFPKDQLSASDLLPQDANSKWAQVNPAGQGSVGDQNFLNAGYHVGVNTVGQTMRNPNLQLRSEPPNPQVQVSPWMNTSMEPDTNRRAMEIGGCE